MREFALIKEGAILIQKADENPKKIIGKILHRGNDLNLSRLVKIFSGIIKILKEKPEYLTNKNKHIRSSAKAILDESA